jgi:hypothetical protein
MDNKVAVIADGKKVKVNDWVFCEFKLQIIKKIDKGQITSVSDGGGCTSCSSLNDRCFSLTEHTNIITKHIDYRYDLLHKIQGINLNFPEFREKFIELWIDACKENTEKCNEYLAIAESIQEKIIKHCEDIRNIFVNDISLLR